MIIHGEAAFVLWPDCPVAYGSCLGKSMSIEISSEKHGKTVDNGGWLWYHNKAVAWTTLKHQIGFNKVQKWCWQINVYAIQ